jgi:hypothetical protein
MGKILEAVPAALREMPEPSLLPDMKKIEKMNK